MKMKWFRASCEDSEIRRRAALKKKLHFTLFVSMVPGNSEAYGEILDETWFFWRTILTKSVR
jgi:hypothetical protein